MIRAITLADGSKRYTARLRGAPQRTFATSREAREYEAKTRKDRTRIRAGLEVEKEAITYEKLCELYLKAYARQSKAWTTTMLGYSRKKWGSTFVRQLEPEMIGPWLSELRDKRGEPLSEKTKHHILERMRAVCNAGVEWGYLGRSPVRARAVMTPGQKRERPIRPMETWEEVEKLADALAAEYTPWGALVRFACATGLRPGEWQALDWTHIDLKQREVNVPGTKNANAVRQVPLSRLALEALQSLPTPLTASLPIFTTIRGKPLRAENYRHWVSGAWRRGLLAAGITARTPYEMRHTFATLGLQAGVPLDVVSKLMGHQSVEVTRRFYAKYTRTTLQGYVPLLDKMGETDAEPEDQDANRSNPVG